jgi:SsrA-binding protein
MGHGHLRGAYVNIKNNELILTNATIAGIGSIPIDESLQTRPRKLLAKRREIDTLIEAKKQGRTIIPVEMYTGSRYIKLKIAIATGKKKYDKRQSLKERDEKRNISSVLKNQRS